VQYRPLFRTPPRDVSGSVSLPGPAAVKRDQPVPPRPHRSAESCPRRKSALNCL